MRARRRCGPGSATGKQRRRPRAGCPARPATSPASPVPASDASFFPDHHRDTLGGLDPELAAERRDRPELEAPNRSFLLAHRDGRLAGREPCEEPERDGVPLLVGECREGDAHRVDLLSYQEDL